MLDWEIKLTILAGVVTVIGVIVTFCALAKKIQTLRDERNDLVGQLQDIKCLLQPICSRLIWGYMHPRNTKIQQCDALQDFSQYLLDEKSQLSKKRNREGILFTLESIETRVNCDLSSLLGEMMQEEADCHTLNLSDSQDGEQREETEVSPQKEDKG